MARVDAAGVDDAVETHDGRVIGRPVSRRTSRGQDQVRPEPEELGNALERPGGVEHDPTTDVRLEQRPQIRNRKGEPLDTHEIDRIQTRSPDLGSELLWAMRISRERPFVERCETPGPLGLADEVQHLGELLVQPLDEDAAQTGRPPRDGRYEDGSSRPNDPPGLAEREEAIRALRQVIQGAEQQNGVDRCVGKIQRSCIARAGVDVDARRGRFSFHVLHVEGNEVAVVDAVAGLREPDRIPTGTASDVGHPGGRLRKMPRDDLLRPFELHHADRRVETVAFFVPDVVRVNLSVPARVHRTIVASPARHLRAYATRWRGVAASVVARIGTSRNRGR